MAENGSPLRRISFAWRSSRFSRSSAFILSAISAGTPGRRPLSTSAFLTQSFSVWGVQPIFAAIDMTACQRDGCWASVSRTSRTARSRTSGENSFVVLLMMLRPAQELEPPADPARSKRPSSPDLPKPSESRDLPHCNKEFFNNIGGERPFAAPTTYDSKGGHLPDPEVLSRCSMGSDSAKRIGRIS